MDEGADPKTCRHDVIQAGIGPGLEFWAVCISCDTEMSAHMMRIGKNYQHDEKTNLWVHQPKDKE